MMWYTRLLCAVLVAIFTLTSLCCCTENTKRAPSGFQGVRGKKSIQDTYCETTQDVSNSMSLTSNIQKRAPSAGFHGMRGKKLVFPLIPLEQGFPSYAAYRAPELLYSPKRTPLGFVEMRGKKEMELVGDDLDKRAPNMGFLGMRGKKLTDDEEAALNNYYMEKRAPNRGFFGMRGKKEYFPLLEENKRAPFDGFFGMRGKKQPGRSGFFGMRGKKYPYEFRGKFVGVRGKKGSNVIPELEMSVQELRKPVDNLDIDELMFLLSDGNGLNWEKRKGRSGFMRMRG